MRVVSGSAGESPSAPVSQPDIPGYRIRRVIGAGGFGTVFEAERAIDGRVVAVKVARNDQPEALLRFDHEARALAKVGPPYVPELYEMGRLDAKNPYLVMEFITAPTLAEVLGRHRGPLPVIEFAPFALALLDAVEAVHARDLIHRDLKPENIFVCESPSLAKLVDFGLVKAIAAGATSATRTAEGTVFGTAEYMSPEQCTGGSEIDRRTDIYALGVIFYEMLTGRPPFFGVPAEVHQAHLGVRPPRPSSYVPLSAALDEVLLRCLAKQAQDRFESVASLRTALREAIATPAIAATPQKQTAPPGSAPREKRAVGLVFFETEEETGQVHATLAFFGGKLAHAKARCYVALFGHEGGENPARRAVQVAHALLARGLTQRAVVDLATVAVQTRPDGSRRFYSPIFSQRDRFPAPTDPPGVKLTSAVAHVVSDAGGDGTLVEAGLAPLVGRESELGLLLDSAHRAIEKQAPTLATVIADAGHGKSRLCTALLEHLRRRQPGAAVVELRAREPVGGDPDQTLRVLLRRILELPEDKPSDRGKALLVQKLGPKLARELWAGVALVLGWVSTEDPELREAAATPGVLREAAARAAALGLRKAASECPLRLVLDDGHFAGQATLDALELATLSDSHVGLWVCVLARPALESMRPEWGRRASRHDAVRLGALEAADAGELFRRLLYPAENVPSSAIDQLVARTRGIPLLTVELARGLKNEGIVRRRENGESWYLATDELHKLPDLPLVEWLARREIDALPAELSAHAQLAALLGAEFTLPEISGVLVELDRGGGAAAFPLDAAVGTRRLVATGLLIAHRNGAYGFRHALIREAIYGSIPVATREQIHRVAFQFYRERSGLPEDERLPREALHAAAGGLREIASQVYLQLAHQAKSRHVYLEAETFYTRTLDYLAGASELRLEALRGRGMMRYRLGRYEDAIEDYGAARKVAAGAGRREIEAEILLDEATALDWMHETRRAKDASEQAEALLAGLPMSPHLEARVLMARGRALYRFAQIPESIAALERAVALAETVGDEAYETLVAAQLMLAGQYALHGSLDESERMFDRLIQQCEQRADRTHLGSAIQNRVFLWLATNRPREAVADTQRYLEISRELGALADEYRAVENLAELAYQMGDLATAVRNIDRAVDLARKLRGDAIRPVALLLKARILAYGGDVEGARALVGQLREHQSKARSSLFMPAEQVLFEMTDLASRDSWNEAEWTRVIAEAKRLAIQADPLEVVEMAGLTALRLGRGGQARAHLQEAIEMAARIPNIMGERLLADLRRLESPR